MKVAEKRVTSEIDVNTTTSEINNAVEGLINNTPFNKVNDVYSTSKFGELTHVDANRPLKKHYEGILKSMVRYGNITVGLVARIKVGKKIVFYILDGKHRFEACKLVNIPFEFKLIDLKNMDDVLNIITILNSTGAKWKGEDYLSGWAIFGKSSYKKLKAINEKHDNITLVTIRRIFKIKPKDFNGGTWVCDNFSVGARMVKQVADISKVMYSSGKIKAQPLRALVHIMELDNYNHKEMLKVIGKNTNKWAQGEGDLKIQLLKAMAKLNLKK